MGTHCNSTSTRLFHLQSRKQSWCRIWPCIGLLATSCALGMGPLSSAPGVVLILVAADHNSSVCRALWILRRYADDEPMSTALHSPPSMTAAIPGMSGIAIRLLKPLGAGEAVTFSSRTLGYKHLQRMLWSKCHTCSCQQLEILPHCGTMLRSAVANCRDSCVSPAWQVTVTQPS